MPESKEMLKSKHTLMGIWQKSTGADWKSSYQWPKLEQLQQQNQAVVSDYITQSGKYPRAHTDINKRLNRFIRGGEETSFCVEFQTN